MELLGSIVKLQTRAAVSGDIVNTLVLEIHGDVGQLHEFLKKPLRVKLEVMEE